MSKTKELQPTLGRRSKRGYRWAIRTIYVNFGVIYPTFCFINQFSPSESTGCSIFIAYGNLSTK